MLEIKDAITDLAELESSACRRRYAPMVFGDRPGMPIGSFLNQRSAFAGIPTETELIPNSFLFGVGDPGDNNLKNQALEPCLDVQLETPHADTLCSHSDPVDIGLVVAQIDPL